MLKTTIDAGLVSGAVHTRHLERVTIDTTVMEKPFARRLILTQHYGHIIKRLF